MLFPRSRQWISTHKLISIVLLATVLFLIPKPFSYRSAEIDGGYQGFCIGVVYPRVEYRIAGIPYTGVPQRETHWPCFGHEITTGRWND